MAGLPVISAATLTAGLRAEFTNNYRSRAAINMARLGRIMQLGIPSDKLTELYAYYESARHFARWPRGENRKDKGFKSVQFSVTNYDWSAAITWHQNDREDDQTKSLYQQAQSAGNNLATLHERVLFQLLMSATDQDLLPVIPTAPDGAALYATTAGGVARFGATDGNLLTDSGVGTGALVRADFFAGLQQFKLFQETEGQPYWGDADLENGYVVIYGAKNEAAFREAFIQGRTIQTQTNVAGTENVGAAAVSNIILESGLKVILWSTPRLTDNDWFIFIDGTPVKTIFQQERRPLRSLAQTVENSDVARNTGLESLMFDARYGYGINIPLSTIKINN